MNPKQRQLGYCQLYNDMAKFACIFIQDKPIEFRYQNKVWMVWLWKGQYGITIGAEVGLYIYDGSLTVTAFGKSFSQKWYRCANDDERLYMSYTLYKNGNKQFTRPYQLHWWLTGFKPGILFWWEKLTLDVTIKFINVEMAQAFCRSYGLPSPTTALVRFKW